MSSSRLPGKVLMDLAGVPVIEGVLTRLRNAQSVNEVILATSDEASDDHLATVVEDAGFEVFRGDLNDVLQRYYDVAIKYPAKHYVRVTGDCPFIDPSLVDELLHQYFLRGADYASNAIEPSLPDGFDCEAFSNEVLQRVHSLAKKPVDREHVTHYIYTHPELFNIYSHTYSGDLSAYRLTLDTAEDYQLIRAICERLDCPYLKAGLADILSVLQRFPELLELNKMYERNEGLKSD